MTVPKITIIIADDHPVFRAGLAAIIRNAPDIDLVAEASDGEELLVLTEQFRPAVVLTDIDMPKMNGIRAAEALKGAANPPKVLFLTLFTDEEFFNKAIDLGVMGFLLKENAASDIISAIRTVAAGKYYLTPSVSDFMIRRSEGSKTIEKEYPGLLELTVTERKILRLVAQGQTTKEIAEGLFISVKTCESHRTNISKKLNLTGTHALVKFASENKNRL
ncbi:MAG: response regulator transcription factor [Bacteroidetes bacterium]|nr:response regulator transcription factor [Bacteroidota bacterium]